jgi:hypothetical protein
MDIDESFDDFAVIIWNDKCAERRWIPLHWRQSIDQHLAPSLNLRDT